MRTILVARKADVFSRILVENGYPVINCPVITTEPIEDLSGLTRVFSGLDEFDGIFVTSSNAADVLVEHHQSELKTYSGSVYVLGQRSFDILESVGATVVFDQDWSSAEDMLNGIGYEDLAAKRFLFVRGERSMRTIPDRLAGVADVEEAIVYRTVPVNVSEESKKEIRQRSVDGSIAMTCFFSPSGVESFAKQVGSQYLASTYLAAIGKTTADSLRALNLNVEVVSNRPISERFAADVLEFMSKTGERSLS